METTQEVKKLQANDAIIMMADAINKNDLPRFYQTVEKYAENFIWTNSTRQSLKHILKNRPMKFQALNELSNDVKKFFVHSEGSDENVFLTEETDILIEELLLEWKNMPSYHYHKIPVRNRLLLHGVTGNGKTTLAKYIAKKSELPFVEIKGTEVIDSHLGTTGRNIYNLFDQIKQPCVLFWDEVDSIGGRRGHTDKNSAGDENDRMTNAMLVNIEKLAQDVVFIAATNRKQSLDSAFLRRFDVQFEVHPPAEFEKEYFAKQLIEYYKIPIEVPDLSNLSSYSDIKACLLQLARSYVANQVKSIDRLTQ